MSAAPEAMQQSTGLVGKLHIHVVVEKGAKIEPLLKQLPKDAQISFGAGQFVFDDGVIRQAVCPFGKSCLSFYQAVQDIGH